MQCLDGVMLAFPTDLIRMEKSSEFNSVFRLYKAVQEQPRIKEYLASDRRQKYSIGIYRHYPELDKQ